MTVFRRTDRVRKFAAATQQRVVRQVRSLHLKGKKFFARSTQPTISHLLRNYKQPLLVTACGIIALVGVGIVGHHYMQAHSVDYYTVMLEGKPVGDVSSEQKVKQFLADKEAALEKANTPVLSALNEGQVTYVNERAYKKKTDDEATLARLDGMLATHSVGVKLIVDGEQIGIVRDQKTADALLQRVKNKYVPVSKAKNGTVEVKSLSLKTGTAAAKVADTVKPERTVTSVSFVEKVTTEPTELATAELSNPDELYLKLTKGEPIPRKYTVKAGDCIGCIASKLNVSEELIYEKNTWIKNDNINIGDVLDLSDSEPPMLNVNSVEQVTEIEVIEPPITYKTSDAMKLGQQKTLKEGTAGKQQVTYRLSKRNGSLLEEEQIAQKVILAPIPMVILKGTKVIRGEGSGKFAWPVVGHRITSYMGTRWGRMHNGIDIVGNSSIMAADEGVVEFAGYQSGGMGNAIIIDHNNGFKTVYGHMKSLKVKKGQIVEKGDVIGIMGSTGHSTGTHLHFEVHLNGKLKNPTSYL
jgi:murein DD-endopeptidase MepM/ murein hydrolase activator NlpD